MSLLLTISKNSHDDIDNDLNDILLTEAAESFESIPPVECSPDLPGPLPTLLLARDQFEHVTPSQDNERNPALNSPLPDIQLSGRFIQSLIDAKVDESGMTKEDILRLRNPTAELPFDPTEPAFVHSLRTFISCANASEQVYAMTQKNYLARHPDETFYSHYQVKKRLELLSGVTPIYHDMCEDSCVGFTGPFADLDSCPLCSKSRWDSKQLARGKRVPRRQFPTIPIGPVIQALYRTPESAKEMGYFVDRLVELDEYLRQPETSHLPKYDDTCCGSEFIELYRDGKIKKGDVLLQMSIDGAQLFRDKASNCWIYMFIIHNLPPHLRYKKYYVIPGGFIGGPNHPKNIESFLQPGLHHIAALQNEGFTYWDGCQNTLIKEINLLIALFTADGPAMADAAGSVRATGKYGCRRFCGLIGRRRANDSHYYPVMLQPRNYDVADCDHPDVTFSDLQRLRKATTARYLVNVKEVCTATNVAQYESRRLTTGISKPTILSGLKQSIGIPNVLVMDLMHLTDLNDPDLLLGLWRATINSYGNDSPAEWRWAVLTGRVWELHGEMVTLCAPFLPVSFGRCPRDIALRINSGYKAWEFTIYLYCLATALLRHVLPEIYWRNFCKFVRGIRLAKQYSQTHEELMECSRLLCEFVKEFEDIYYQRKAERIHFVRQSIHMLTHIAPETYRIGPLPCYSQFAMETLIGNLGGEIGSLVEPFVNIANRGIYRAQINCIRATMPGIDLELEVTHSSKRLDVGRGYYLLSRKDKIGRDLTAPQAAALRELWIQQNWPNLDGFAQCNQVKRRGRLQLPNTQVVRSVWHENFSSRKDRRRATIAKVSKFFICHVELFSHRSSLVQTAQWGRIW
jgi:hypothetical protein